MIFVVRNYNEKVIDLQTFIEVKKVVRYLIPETGCSKDYSLQLLAEAGKKIKING